MAAVKRVRSDLAQTRLTYNYAGLCFLSFCQTVFLQKMVGCLGLVRRQRAGGRSLCFRCLKDELFICFQNTKRQTETRTKSRMTGFMNRDPRIIRFDQGDHENEFHDERRRRRPSGELRTSLQPFTESMDLKMNPCIVSRVAILTKNDCKRKYKNHFSKMSSYLSICLEMDVGRRVLIFTNIAYRVVAST